MACNSHQTHALGKSVVTLWSWMLKFSQRLMLVPALIFFDVAIRVQFSTSRYQLILWSYFWSCFSSPDNCKLVSSWWAMLDLWTTSLNFGWWQDAASLSKCSSASISGLLMHLLCLGLMAVVCLHMDLVVVAMTFKKAMCICWTTTCTTHSCNALAGSTGIIVVGQLGLCLNGMKQFLKL